MQWGILATFHKIEDKSTTIFVHRMHFGGEGNAEEEGAGWTDKVLRFRYSPLTINETCLHLQYNYNKKRFRNEIILFPGDAFHMLLMCRFGAFFACLLSLNSFKCNTFSLC
uniref:Galectin n=1 Tax=Parascaris univalens TaxID=6257 RepID=A0A915B188_PARUN